MCILILWYWLQISAINTVFLLVWPVFLHLLILFICSLKQEMVWRSCSWKPYQDFILQFNFLWSQSQLKVDSDMVHSLIFLEQNSLLVFFLILYLVEFIWCQENIALCLCVRFLTVPYVNCFGRIVFYVSIEYCIWVNIYHVSAQGIDEHMINVHYYYY